MWRKLETFQYIMTNAFFAFPRRFSFLWKQTWLTFTTLMRSSSSQSCVLICLCVVLIVAIFNRQITFREILAWRNVNNHIAYNLAISVSLHYLSELKDIEVKSLFLVQIILRCISCYKKLKYVFKLHIDYVMTRHVI